MDQFAIGLFPLVYAGYAQMKIKGYKQVRNKPETIALKVKIGFQLQIAIVQLIELIIALFHQELLSALCSLFLLIGLFYSFGITVIFHHESLLTFLPFICLFNLICNEPILKLFDLLSLVLSSLLVIYQRQRGDDPLEYNPFCEFFEQQDSFIVQYLILFKFQPNAYSEEIELHELNESTLQDQLLVTHQTHQQQQHPTSQVAQFLINQTRQSTKLEAKHLEPMDIKFSKDDDEIWDKKIEVVESPKQLNRRKVRSSQIIMEENSQSEDVSHPSFKEEVPKTNFNRRSISQREINQDPDDEPRQVIVSDDENDKINKEETKQYDYQSSNCNQPKIQPQQQQVIEIVDIDKLGADSPLKQEPTHQNFDFVEDNQYPEQLIVIPQQIQQELNKKKQQRKKKQKDEGLIAKRNRMIKRIKSFEEFQDKNDDNKSQNSDQFDDKKSDYERYKDELSSATLSEDESESGVYIQQKMEKVQFIVGRQVVKKLINYQHTLIGFLIFYACQQSNQGRLEIDCFICFKTLIPITIKVKNDQWVQNCQYQELYQLANGHLPKPTYGDAEIEKKFFYIQQWLDGMSQNPILMRKEILEFFNVPESIINKYGLVKKIEEETRVQRNSNKFMNSTQREYFLQIKQIKVECFSSETSDAFAGIIYFSLRFKIQTEKKSFVSECKRTIDEIKEATKIIQQERNLRVSLQDHETVKKQMKAIDQFLSELFGHQFYYCDKLFEQFGLLSQIK